jgi:hypothetical protein
MKPHTPFHSPSRRSERGEGNLGNLIKLAIAGTVAVAAFQAAPVFLANFKFRDALSAFARRFPPNPAGDAQAKEALPALIEEQGLSNFVDPANCSIRFDGGKGGGQRTVKCAYKREYTVLGQKRVASFEPEVNEPVF